MEDTNINPSVPPAYSPPENSQAPPRAHREPTIHLYELTNSKSRPWAVLRVASNAASSAQLPHVYEGEPIIGSVNLDLEKGVQIKSVSITVRSITSLRWWREYDCIAIYPRYQGQL